MTTNPSMLIAPVSSAFPKYAGVLDALAALIAGDASAVATSPPLPTPAPPTDPAALTVIAGRPILLAGDGTVCAFDFGDSAARFNALRGYNASHVYDTPGSYVATITPVGQSAATTHVTVLPDSRPTIALAAGDDLAAAIARITTPTIVLLAPGATYDVKMPIALAVDGVTLRAAPSTGSTSSPQASSPRASSGQVSPGQRPSAGPAPASTNPPQPAPPPPCIRRLAAAGVYSTLIIGAADIGIEGITFDSDQPLTPANAKVGIYALNIMGRNLLVRDCTFRNVDDGLHCQAKARGLVAIDCRFTNELRSCGAYLDAMTDVTLLGLTAAGSICEHIVRLEGSQRVLLHGCDLDNRDGKETVAIRMGQCVAIVSNTLRAWARISQGIQAPAAIYCRNVLFAENHFAGLRPDGPWLQINPGSQSVAIDANTFDVDASQVAVAVQAPAVGLTLTNNRLSMVNGAATCRPLVDPFGNPSFAETGTVKAAVAKSE